MKRVLGLLVCAMLVLSLVAGGAFAESGKLSVCASFYPMFDFAQKIGGDKVEVINMVPSGMEPHDWEPTPLDIVTLENTDVFVYNGAGMEHWVEDVLASLSSKSLITVEASNGIALMEGHAHEHKEGEEHDHSHESFTEADVKDRTIADFAGDWQSIYPYFADGTLDEVVVAAAEMAGKTVDEMRAFTENRLHTDVDRIAIEGNEITFHYGNEAKTASYEYAGNKVLKDDSGALSVRYQFSAVDGSGGAPKYVQFDDHGFKPGAAAHYHIYFGDEGFDALLGSDKSFTYFPASAGGATILEEMMEHFHSDEKEHEEANEEAHEHDHGGMDPHVWLNPANAKVEMENIKNAFVQADPANAAYYEANYEKWAMALDALDQEFKDALSSFAGKDIIVAHQAFGYLCAAYGLNQVAIEGLSPDSEPDPARVAEIIDFAKEHDVKVIFFEELVSPKVAETIAKAIGAKTDVLSPVEGLSDEQLASGGDYLSAMRQNLKALTAALA